MVSTRASSGPRAYSGNTSELAVWRGGTGSYRDWREWAHEVHNLPNNNNQQNKSGGATHKKYSDNIYSGPASTSKSYTRDRDTPSPTKSSSSNNNDHQRLKHPPGP